MPDFPRGVIVRVAVAMNGVEFVQCPGELRVFQSPRLTELFPSWVSATTTLELELRGINLTATISATSMEDNNRGQHEAASVQVSFSSSRGRKVIRGICENGQVRCPIPREILQASSSLGREKSPAHSATAMASPSSLTFGWVGNTTRYVFNTFVGLARSFVLRHSFTDQLEYFVFDSSPVRHCL